MKRLLREGIPATAAIALVVWLYWWTVASVGGLGPPGREPSANDYYNHLVAGFMQGHLYMDLPVSEALKALPDPYDPAQNEPHRVTDASYFNGHYYLYFGAAPAVTLLLPYRLVTGLFLPTPWAILIFVSIGFVAASAVFLALRRRSFPDAPAWTAPVGVLVLGVGSTADVLLRRPFFWELATAGGYAFAMLALAAVYGAIHSARRTGAWMAAAGLCLGLAVASRPTYVYAVPVLGIPLLAWARMEGVNRRWWRMAISGAAGLSAMGLAVFAYNRARFGSGFEFGHNYLLSVAYESKVRLFGLDYFWFNLRMYFARLGAWSWYPPFFAPIPVPRAEMPPGFYTVDDPFGLLPVFPITLLALFAPFATRGSSGDARCRARATLLAITVLLASCAAVILLYVATIPRYAVDFLPALMLLVTIGMLVAVAAGRDRLQRTAIRAGVLGLVVVSLAMGTLTIFDLGRLFSHRHPDGMDRIVAVTRHLEFLRDQAHGIHYGPVELTLTFATGIQPARCLLRSGDPRHPDQVIMEQRSAHAVRFGIQHDDGPTQWSRTIDFEATPTHRLYIELGSFYPPPEHGFFAGAGNAKASWLAHRAEIRLDGRTVLRTFAPFEPGRRGAPGAADQAYSGNVPSFVHLPANLAARAIDAPDNLFLSFAAPRRPGVFPLVSAGQGARADILVLEARHDGRGRLGYFHGDAAPLWSPEFALQNGTPGELELRQTEYGWTVPTDGDRLLVAWLNGLLAWKIRVPAFRCDPDDVTTGRAPTGEARVEQAFPDGVKTVYAPPAARSPGGPLLARVIMPDGVKGAWQPVVAIGHAGAADTLSAYYIGLDVAQFRFDHWAAPLVMGNTIAVDKNVGHDLELYLPSFAADGYGQPGEGEAWATLDGREILRIRTPAYGFAPEELSLGENRARATMDDRLFRGCFIQRDWPGATSVR